MFGSPLNNYTLSTYSDPQTYATSEMSPAHHVNTSTPPPDDHHQMLTSTPLSSSENGANLPLHHTATPQHVILQKSLHCPPSCHHFAILPLGLSRGRRAHGPWPRRLRQQQHRRAGHEPVATAAAASDDELPGEPDGESGDYCGIRGGDGGLELSEVFHLGMHAHGTGSCF